MDCGCVHLFLTFPHFSFLFLTGTRGFLAAWPLPLLRPAALRFDRVFCWFVWRFSAGLLWLELNALRAEGNSAGLSISMERASWGRGTEESVAVQGLSSLPGRSTLRYHGSRGEGLTDIFLISQKLEAESNQVFPREQLRGLLRLCPNDLSLPSTASLFQTCSLFSGINKQNEQSRADGMCMQGWMERRQGPFLLATTQP